MSRTFRALITTAFALGTIVVGGKVAHATVTCPPLCLLPPDPAPPMPPINYPDPPFKPTVATNPNSHNNGTATQTAAPAHVTVTGKAQAGGECKSGDVSGTLVPSNGKFTCNFTPSTLPVGGACHAMDKIGVVTVVDGKRYCKIQP
ncbi:MAG: hypothetical protein ABSB50_04155 [Terracidiphilus sp.]